jgi:hypothetical protein
MKKLILIALLGAMSVYASNKLTTSIKYLFAAKKKTPNKNQLLYAVTFIYLEKQFSEDAKFVKEYYYNENILQRVKYNASITPEEIANNQTEMERLFSDHFINSKMNNIELYSRIKKIVGNENRNVQKLEALIKKNKKYNK